MSIRTSKQTVARVATVAAFVALALVAASSGTSSLLPAEASAATTGTLLKMVATPACSGGGSVLATISGRMLNIQALTVFPVLLAVGCPSSNQISFIDPSSGTTEATVSVANLPAGGFRSLAARPDAGDLLGCANTTVTPVDGSPFLTTQIYSIPLTASSGSATQLLSTTLANGVGTCDGLAWDGSDKSVYVAPLGVSIFHVVNTGTNFSTFTVAAVGGNCGVIGGLAIAGSTLLTTSQPNGITQLVQISKDGCTTFPTLFTPAQNVDAIACDPATFASSGNGAVWARDTAQNQVYAFALPLYACTAPFGTVGPSGPTCPTGSSTGMSSTAGDGIPDCWKTNGIDVDGDGIADYTLPTLGTAPSINHKDVYLEIDSYSTGCSSGPSAPTCAPSTAVRDAIVAAFNNAPVSNPDGTTGIHLHVLLDDSLPVPPPGSVNAINLPPCTPLPEPANTQDFDSLKHQFFGTVSERGNSKLLAAKAFVFHYAISAPALAGLGTTSGCSELPGNDIVVALGGWSFSSAAVRDATWEGTIMHELGHNLGLRHGGGATSDTDASGKATSANCKPNYLSVMNYAFQVPGSVPVTTWKLDYSREQLPTLNEAALAEPVGVFGTTTFQTLLNSLGSYTAFGIPTKTGGAQITSASAGGPLNFNGSRTGPTQTVSSNVNNFGLGSGCDGTGTILAGFDDWDNLIYTFQSTLDFADGVHGSTNGRDNQEITQEQETAILANTAPLITLTKTSPDHAVVGGQITYTIKATNVGPKTATNVLVVDSLPTGVTFTSATPSTCSASAGVVTCNVGSLDVGSTFTATVTVTVNKGSGGALTDQAAVSSDPDNTLFRSNVTFTSLYAFGGFNPPINNPPAVNPVQSGSTIPVKFSLGGNFGLAIFASTPFSQQVSCSGLPGTVNVVSGTATQVTSPGNVDFNLIAAPNQYIFNWQTSTAYAGTCRELVVSLNDGTTFVAFFQFS
jgi:uncharacterized repeat protein (TIGR01451 family)